MGKTGTSDTSKSAPLKRSQRHRPGHFAILVMNILVAIACFIGAAVLIAGQQVINDIHKTDAISTPTTQEGVSFHPTGSSTATTVATVDGSANSTPAATASTVEDFPVADPEARNFLITGSDNGACDDPNSATQVGERDTLGERSDTIMVMRVDPSTNRAAVLSFPRDLWVHIAGADGNNRINGAYKVDEPQKLVDTIYLNFGIAIDHYIQIDFCAFKTLVDSVDGIDVPFAFQARDIHTNLHIDQTGCVHLDGSTALAYVRSRHYQYLDPKTNKFKEDPSSDYGRISRQQDFLRRAVAKVLAQGYSVDVMRGLIDVATNYVVIDRDLTLNKMLEFAGVLQHLDPVDIKTYTIEGRGFRTSGGAAVIEPLLDGPNMKAILAIFQGSAQLETAPEQVFESTTSSVPRTTTTQAASTSDATTVTTASPASTTTTSTLPTVTVDQEIRGIVPPRDLICPS